MFTEQLHPRAPKGSPAGGQFTTGGSKQQSKAASAKKAPAKLNHQQLHQLLVQQAHGKKLTAGQLHQEHLAHVAHEQHLAAIAAKAKPAAKPKAKAVAKPKPKPKAAPKPKPAVKKTVAAKPKIAGVASRF